MAKSAMPTGAIVAFAGLIAPSGWLLCDGTQISRTKYKDLFAVIGTSHGYGNNRTTFHLPDFRGRFIRGADMGAGNDPDAATRTAANTGGNTGDAVGSYQADQFQGHAHYIGLANSGDGGNGSSQSQVAGPSANISTTGLLTDTVNGTPRAGTETRSKNISQNFIIKT